MLLLPASIVPALLPFAPLFTTPTWCHVQVLATGTLLAQGQRTVVAALRVMGLAHEPRFERDHRVLSRERWPGVQGSQILLGLLIALLPPGWSILVVVDETLERRKGARVTAKEMYRDAVRSSNSHVVTCLGLQWVCMALIVPLALEPAALGVAVPDLAGALATDQCRGGKGASDRHRLDRRHGAPGLRVPQRPSGPDLAPAPGCTPVRAAITGAAGTAQP